MFGYGLISIFSSGTALDGDNDLAPAVSWLDTALSEIALSDMAVTRWGAPAIEKDLDERQCRRLRKRKAHVANRMEQRREGGRRRRRSDVSPYYSG